MNSRVKQSEKILDALEYGCETTREIMAYTSLRRGVCAAWLSKLRDDGWVAVVGSSNYGGRGRQGYRWQMKRIDDKGAGRLPLGTDSARVGYSVIDKSGSCSFKQKEGSRCNQIIPTPHL